MELSELESGKLYKSGDFIFNYQSHSISQSSNDLLLSVGDYINLPKGLSIFPTQNGVLFTNLSLSKLLDIEEFDKEEFDSLIIEKIFELGKTVLNSDGQSEFKVPYMNSPDRRAIFSLLLDFEKFLHADEKDEIEEAEIVNDNVLPEEPKKKKKRSKKKKEE